MNLNDQWSVMPSDNILPEVYSLFICIYVAGKTFLFFFPRMLRIVSYCKSSINMQQNLCHPPRGYFVLYIFGWGTVPMGL